MGKRALPLTVTALALVAVAGACSDSAPARPVPDTAAAPARDDRPLTAWLATPEDYPAPSTVAPCDPRESLTPLSPLPKSGNMPAGSTMEKIRRRGHLIVGVDQNTRYFAELNRRGGGIEGFDIDMAKRVARAIFGEDGHVRYTVITQAQRIPMLENGSVDLVVDTMTITCARKAQVAFSSDYYTDGQRILVSWDSNARTLEDLRGKRVCTVRKTTSIVILRDSPAGVLPYAVNNWTDCLVALQQGEVDAISTTTALLMGLVDQDPDTKVPDGVKFSDEPHGMAVPPGQDDFVRFLNGVLEEIKRNGEWQALYDKWLKVPLGPQAPPKAVYSG